MAWTAPRTYVAAEVVTAAILNTDHRDNLKMLSDPWGSYTTTWTATSVNPAIGNGTLSAFYMQVGKWVRFRIILDYGSTTTAGTGTWGFTLPMASVVARGALGEAVCYDGSILYPRVAFQNSSTGVVVADMTPTRIGPTTPFSWNSSSELNIIGEYEAA